MLRALQEIHRAGFLHRDIKPGNFVMGTVQNGNPRAVILIDYGLSRRHLKADGTVKPKRQQARWVGSRRYMSLNTHLRKDQGLPFLPCHLDLFFLNISFPQAVAMIYTRYYMFSLSA